MNKTELQAAVAERLEVSKAEAGRIVETIVGTIVEGAKEDGKCIIPGLGNLVSQDVPARSGVAMGVEWHKEAHKTLKLRLNTAGKALAN